MLALLVMILSKSCKPDEILEEGLIWCNNSICNEYCYENICIKSKNVWFCFQEGIFYYWLIKLSPTLLFYLIGYIIHYLYNRDNFQNSKSKSILFVRFISEFFFNFMLVSLFNICVCEEFDNIHLILLIILNIYGFLPFSLLFYITSPFCKINLDFNLSLNLFSCLKIIHLIENILINIWIIIFTITGYYFIFDLFAYVLLKKYRNEFDSLK